MDLVTQDYWNQSYEQAQFGIANDPVTRWLDRYLPSQPGSVFEVGCYPGRYLAHFGTKGWTLGGMDLTPRTESHLLPWLNHQGFQTRSLLQGDVLSYLKGEPEKADLVCSFGFIEHFDDFLSILCLHDRALREGGTLIVTTPNFAGSIQRTLHERLDSDNLSRHNLNSMVPSRWAVALRDLGHDVIFDGFFGGFDFWADRQSRNLVQKGGVIAAKVAARAFRWLPDHPRTSPYCGIVTRKR